MPWVRTAMPRRAPDVPSRSTPKIRDSRCNFTPGGGAVVCGKVEALSAGYNDPHDFRRRSAEMVCGHGSGHGNCYNRAADRLVARLAIVATYDRSPHETAWFQTNLRNMLVATFWVAVACGGHSHLARRGGRTDGYVVLFSLLAAFWSLLGPTGTFWAPGLISPCFSRSYSGSQTGDPGRVTDWEI